ncbi:MAG: hypothetical protein IJS73_02010 [Paludibacteraceae bacterium]|nr:hypothetical protein [Paludibacteraceae bacterium]
MKKPVKIALCILASLLGLVLIAGIIVILYGNTMLEKTIRKEISKTPVTVEDINANLLLRSITLKGINYSQQIPDSITGDTNIVNIRLGELSVHGINYKKKQKNIHIGSVCLDSADIQAVAQLQNGLQKTDSQNISLPAIPQGLVNEISVGELQLKNANTDLVIKNNPYLAKNINLTLNDLRFNLRDTTFSYNDSVYAISLDKLLFTSPDGLFSLTTGLVETTDGGAIIMSDIKGGHTTAKNQLADKLGKIPTTWAQFDIKTVRTSPVNIFRMAQANAVNIDTVYVTGNSAHIYRDLQYDPKEPFPMPQDALMNMPLPLKIGRLIASMPKLQVELTMTGKTVGQLPINNLKATVSNITNEAKKTITASVNAGFGMEAMLQAVFSMTLDKNKHFSLSLNGTNAHGADLDEFMNPLFGVKVGCDIHQLKMTTKGDKLTSSGSFLMVYNNLKINIEKNTPIEQISKYAGVINAVAPLVLFEKNPRFKNKDAMEFDVSWRNDVTKDFAFYMMGPMIDGMIQTVLPKNIVKTIKKQINKHQQ